jgi:hypothetical protein
MTGIKELDLELQSKIKQVTIAYHTDCFFMDTDITIAIISPVPKIKMKFEDLLFELRKRNIRVILLLENEKSKYLPIALSLGIADIIFDPVTIEKIIDKLKYPTPFSDIAKYYDKNKIYQQSNSKNNNIPTNEKILKAQIINLFKFFNKDKDIDKNLSVNELLVLLNNEIIKKVCK